MKTAHAVRPVEGLESRVHLSVGPTLKSGLLTLRGDNKLANEIIVKLNADDTTKLDVSFNGTTTQYAATDVTRITFVGGKRDDRLVIDEVNGAINIGAKFYGRGGNDTIIGGSGNDYVKGDQGDDLINGGAGDDRLYGFSGKDQISGDDGNDTVNGGVGDDVLFGNDGNDKLYGLNGSDDLDGGAGDDSLDGGAGNDDLLGGDGVDYINARVGSDSVVSGAGADTVKLGKKSTAADDPEDI